MKKFAQLVFATALLTTASAASAQDGKIAKTYHLENWLSALGQLRAK
jgi:hypothetical protein